MGWSIVLKQAKRSRNKNKNKTKAGIKIPQTLVQVVAISANTLESISNVSSTGFQSFSELLYSIFTSKIRILKIKTLYFCYCVSLIFVIWAIFGAFFESIKKCNFWDFLREPEKLLQHPVKGKKSFFKRVWSLNSKV